MKLVTFFAVAVFASLISSGEARMCAACRTSSHCRYGYSCLGRRGDPYGRCYRGYEGIPCSSERNCAHSLRCVYNVNYGRRVCSPAPRRCSHSFQCNGVCLRNGYCTIGFPRQLCRYGSDCMTGRCWRNRCTGCPNVRNQLNETVTSSTEEEFEEIDDLMEGEVFAEISSEPEVEASVEPEN